eukprot:900743-Prymnesium_polylepis.1
MERHNGRAVGPGVRGARKCGSSGGWPPPVVGLRGRRCAASEGAADATSGVTLHARRARRCASERGRACPHLHQRDGGGVDNLQQLHEGGTVVRDGDAPRVVMDQLVHAPRPE